MATAAQQSGMQDPPGQQVNYRFPAGLQRNLLWFVLRKLRPANPIFLFQHLADTYGDIAHYKLGHHHIVFLNLPEFIREVLVVQNDNFIKERTVQRTKMLLGEGMITAEGAAHRAQRLAAQPAFHRQRIVDYAGIMVEEAARIRDSWHAGERRDIAADMMDLTLNVVARTLFATDLRQEVYELAAALNRILGLMLAASPGNDQETRQSLRDQVITIFLAGYETVANALSWTWYLLSQNPDCESKFHNEVDSVLAGRLPAFEDVP